MQRLYFPGGFFHHVVYEIAYGVIDNFIINGGV